MPAFHAFTGCDYTAAFYNKGKVKPFKIFSKRKDFQEIFASLMDPTDLLINEKTSSVQEFTALLYGIKNCFNINEARYMLFQKTYATCNNKEHFIKKIKGMDSNMMPPCWKSLKQKILRTIYVNSMWHYATNSSCVKLNPTDCGWFYDICLKPTSFIGDATPLQVEDVLKITEIQTKEEADLQFEVATSDESESE